VIPGPNSAEQARQCVEFYRQIPPESLWDALKASDLLDNVCP
jgi:hypothetical protein